MRQPAHVSQAPRARLAPGAETLAAAARAVAGVVSEGRAADGVLALAESRADRAAVRAITLGTLRWYLRLEPAIASLLQRPSGELAPLVRALLAASAHQIEHSRNPPQSTVHLAVDAARALGQARATGLVNAVLRRFVAERSAIFARLDADPAVRSASPAWLVAALRRDWPHHWQQILAAGNAHPPMTLRVDLSRGSAEACLAELAAAGHAARTLAWCPTAVELERPIAAGALPGFREGRVSVQDAGAQLAAPLLRAGPGMRVLDACAAPGGKTGHLLESAPGLAELVAADDDPQRLSKVRDNLRRLGRTARLVVADLSDAGGLPAELREAAPFERVLVDAPCSATGVVRRHPDIKLLRRESDIGPLAATQLAILRTCFGRLATGGRLVYCTCSVLDAENDAVIGRLLESEPGAHATPWPAGLALPPGAVHRRFGVQLLPGAEAGTDGFYYACLEKAAGTSA